MPKGEYLQEQIPHEEYWFISLPQAGVVRTPKSISYNPGVLKLRMVHQDPKSHSQQLPHVRSIDPSAFLIYFFL